MDYIYKAELKKVVDGDTIDLNVDLGFRVWSSQRFRLARIDTPEIRSKDKDEKKKGLLSKAFVIEKLEAADSIEVESIKTGKFGRWLAEITFETDGVVENLNNLLLSTGHAEVYK